MVTSAAAEISLRHERFEFVAKRNRLRRVVTGQHVPQILHNDITATEIQFHWKIEQEKERWIGLRVVVGFHEPIGLVAILFPHVSIRFTRFGPQIVTAFADWQSHRRQRTVYKQKQIKFQSLFTLSIHLFKPSLVLMKMRMLQRLPHVLLT